MAGKKFGRICVGLMIAAAWVACGVPASVQGASFFVHRHGTDTDTAHAEFVALLQGPGEASFDPVDSYPDDTPVSALKMGDYQLDLFGDWEGPYVPVTGYSSAFNVEGRVHEVALVAGYSLTVSPAEGGTMYAVGMWVFDDRRAYDSAYFVEVTETDGTVSSVLLENEIEQNSSGHEIEGFVGAVSEIGIASMRIVAVDPATQLPQADFFEVDHILADIRATPPEPETPLPTPHQSRPRGKHKGDDKAAGKCSRERREHVRDRWNDRRADRAERRREHDCQKKNKNDDKDNRDSKKGRK